MFARITIVGRPNVGKSSLFNALTGHKIAIVSDIENTTRDILEYRINDEEHALSYIVADSGGLAFGSDDEILHDVRTRVEQSINESEIIVFVLEYDKITTFDEEIAKLLRRSGKHVIVVANKADNHEREREGFALLSLGFEDVIPTSMVHHRGVGTIRATIAKRLEEMKYSYHEEQYPEDTLKVAIIGRPNVGKSSLINAITGENVAMVRDMPGTTRDSIDTDIDWNGEKIILIDTAGIRRGGKIGVRNIEDWSVMRSERAIERADIAVVVIDANEGITGQDQAIVGKALELNKGLILVFNKWDIVLGRDDVANDNKMENYIKYIQRKFDFIDYAEYVFTSAIDGKRVDKILELAAFIRDERKKRVKTGIFNDFLEQVVLKHNPTGSKKSHKPKIYYGSQVDINPPKFVISVNNANHFHFSYPRFLENQIREFFGFKGTPIIVELKSRMSIFKKGGGLKEPEEIATEKAKVEIDRLREKAREKAKLSGKRSPKRKTK